MNGKRMAAARQLFGLPLALALGAATLPASAAVSFYTDLPTFQAQSVTSLEATFESIEHEGEVDISTPYTEGRVTFSSPNPLYNATPGGHAATFFFDVPITSNVLTSSGNQDITLTFSGAAPTAVGFDSVTNRFAAPVVTVFDTAHSLIGSFTLTQGPSTIGFVGITSSVGIGEVRWLADRGDDRDTGIDNIRVGTVPEPQSWALMMVGLAVFGFVRRTRPTPGQRDSLEVWRHGD